MTTPTGAAPEPDDAGCGDDTAAVEEADRLPDDGTEPFAEDIEP